MSEELVDEACAIELIRWFEAFLDPGWIDEQIKIREHRAAAFGRWSPPHVHGNVLVDTIAVFRHHVATRGAVEALFTHLGKNLLTSASNVRHVANHLVGERIEALKSLLRRETVAGFLYQCMVAAHYIRDGYRLVSFSVGEDEGGDVVVGNELGEVELQCKAIRPGAGRRINNHVFDDLAMRVLNEADRLGWRGTILLECEGRLGENDVPQLANASAAFMRDRVAGPEELPAYAITVERRVDNVSPQEVTLATAGDLDQPLRRPHVAVLGNQSDVGVRVLLIGISKKHDKVVGKMLATANAAAEQLGGLLPGLVCVHTPESIAWQRVALAGVLDKHVSRGFRHFANGPVTALVFTSADDGGNAYVYRNPHTSLPLPKGFRIVGESTGDRG